MQGHACGLALALLISLPVHAQDTSEDYRRAENFLSWNVRQKIFRMALRPNWLAGQERFWYLREAREGATFVMVDAASGRTGPAFDHSRIAAELRTKIGMDYPAANLPLRHFSYSGDGSAIGFSVGSVRWRCALPSYRCGRVAASDEARHGGESRSPDGRWAVFRNGHDLAVRDLHTGRAWPLTGDGRENYEYGGPLPNAYDRMSGSPEAPWASFSPDSRRIFTYRFDTRQVQDRKTYLIQTVPGSRPVLHPGFAPLPGEEVRTRLERIVLDLASAARVDLQPEPLARRQATTQMPFAWNESGSRIYFADEEPSYRESTFYVTDLATGRQVALLKERSRTYVDRSPLMAVVGEGDEVILSSERDDWRHLYLVDGHGSGIKRQLTAGQWRVDEIVHVDSRRRWVYFTAQGRESGRNPYYRHLYRVGLDRAHPELLTPEDAEHAIRFSPSGRFFVDSHSRVDMAPRHVLRSADGRLVRVLEDADIGELLASGWKFPEAFRVKARDGVTDLHGILVRPTRFDPRKTYPVVDHIYAWPTRIFTPRAFSPEADDFGWAQSIAELGFVVVIMDGLGTPGRSKSYLDFSFGNLGDAGLEDHIAAIRQLARRYPYLDPARMGVFGQSAGGYAATRAILKFPEFFKVSVAWCGWQDSRTMAAAMRYQGLAVNPGRDPQSNAALAGNLKGKLLLVHGGLDNSVSPDETSQLVDALIGENKDFDMTIAPNRDHNMYLLAEAGGPMADAFQAGRTRTPDLYLVRQRWDYLVRHLLGTEPPPAYRITVPVLGDASDD